MITSTDPQVAIAQARQILDQTPPDVLPHLDLALPTGRWRVYRDHSERSGPVDETPTVAPADRAAANSLAAQLSVTDIPTGPILAARSTHGIITDTLIAAFAAEDLNAYGVLAVSHYSGWEATVHFRVTPEDAIPLTTDLVIEILRRHFTIIDAPYSGFIDRIDRIQVVKALVEIHGVDEPVQLRLVVPVEVP